MDGTGRHMEGDPWRRPRRQETSTGVLLAVPSLVVTLMAAPTRSGPVVDVASGGAAPVPFPVKTFMSNQFINKCVKTNELIITCAWHGGSSVSSVSGHGRRHWWRHLSHSLSSPLSFFADRTVPPPTPSGCR